MKIIAEHPEFWVIHKPAGVGFHREGNTSSFLDGVRDITGEALLFPVHRLDRLTSGVILVARSADAAGRLGRLFAEGGIEKYYLALSDRSPTKKQGLVSGAMVKGRNGSWRLGALTASAEQAAFTQFFSVGLGNMRVMGDAVIPGDAHKTLRLFVVRPRTGRTHQIRVALKSVGSPILGDERYGGAAADRGYLHAYALHFGWGAEEFSFVVPPDSGSWFCHPGFTGRLAEFERPWELPWPKLSLPTLRS